MSQKKSDDNRSQRLQSLAAQQFGLLSRAQIRAAGISWHQERARIDSGEWELLYDRVVRLSGAPISYRQRVASAAMAVGGVASHRSAAAIYGIGGIKAWEIEVATRRGRPPKLPGAIVHRPKYLPDEDVTNFRGIPITTPVRTLHDLGAVVGPAVVKRATEDVLTGRLATAAQARHHLERWGRSGRGGTKCLRRALAELGVQVHRRESALEDELVALLEREGFGDFVTQKKVVGPDGFIVGRVDVLFPRDLLVIEALGWEFHSSLVDFLRDNRRRNELVALGYRVLTFLWDDVERPADFLRTLRTSLAA